MLTDATLRNFEDRFQLVQSKAKDAVLSAHCAMCSGPPVSKSSVLSSTLYGRVQLEDLSRQMHDEVGWSLNINLAI